jgi:hypothetical protein
MQPRSTPAICLGPTSNIQGSYYFFSLMNGMLIKQRCWTELPVPQSIIDRVAFYAKKSDSPPDLVFADCHHQTYNWPDNDIIGSDESEIAIYPDIPANIPGVDLDHQPLSHPHHQLSPSDDPDWAQMADEALANADIDNMDLLPTPPEVIVINDDDDVPLPSTVKQTLTYLQKFEPENHITPSLPSPSVSLRHSSSRQCNLPKHLQDYHIFTTVANDIQTSFPYVDASWHTVDLAMDDEQCIATVCHYVMLHCAESTFVGNPNNKKQYGLKAGLKKFAE